MGAEWERVPVKYLYYPEKSLLKSSKRMSELLKQKKGRRYIPLKLKLAAVRSYVLQELSYSEVHQKYGVSSSTFARWLERYKLEILSLEHAKRLSLSVPKSILPVKEQEQIELERLRREVEDLRLAKQAYELMLELAKERLNVDVKKNYEEMLSTGLRTKPGKGKLDP